MPEHFVRHANYGLELIDALTGAGILGTSRISAEFLAPPVPGSGARLEPFLATLSRWVFEDLENDVEIRIEAQHYVAETLRTGVDLPAIPPSTQPGVLNRVQLKPRTGYPFAASVTRVVGLVRLASALNPATPIVPGAAITITPEYPASGSSVSTRTTEDGQYVMWFLPDLTQSQPLPASFSVTATATVLLGGSPVAVSGSLPSQPLTPQTLNGAPVLSLA